MPLTSLDCFKTPVSDLTPLEGMPLTDLVIVSTKVVDLSPIRQLPLRRLWFGDDDVADLSPLKGMKLNSLSCNESRVSDLSPLEGMNLTEFFFTPRTATKGVAVIRQMKSLTTIGINGLSQNRLKPADFWKKFDAGEFGKPVEPIITFNDPAFKAWLAETQKLPAEKQLEAVSKKLMELNPGFDGKLLGMNAIGHPEGLPKIDKATVTEVGLFVSQVSDLSPIRAFAGLRRISCERSGSTPCKLTSLEPLRGMALNKVICPYTEISDLWPLEGMPLTILECGSTKVSDLSPLRGAPLSQLYCSNSRVRDLSPLEGAPLAVVIANGADIDDLRPLERCQNLTKLSVKKSKVTAVGVAALQKALPNCKIEWDGSVPSSPVGDGPKATANDVPAQATPASDATKK
jgi:Leucine-rich repeat (LRR) protein